VMRAVGLRSHFLERELSGAGGLSVGERQLVSFARALLQVGKAGRWAGAWRVNRGTHQPRAHCPRFYN
jgi:ABC-type hemin transport system ATPase subunit